MATSFSSTDAQTNADAVVVMPAVIGIYNVITMLVPTYSAGVSGSLVVKNGTNVIFDTNILVPNPGPIDFNEQSVLRSSIGDSLESRLAAGGLAVLGKLAVIGYTTDSYQ